MNQQEDLLIQNPEERQERSRQRIILISIFSTVMFLFFLVLKVPQAKIQNLVVAHMKILFQSQGLGFSAEKVSVGILLGPSVKLENVELKAFDDEHRILKIPYLKIKPHLIPLVVGMRKISFSAELLGGEVSGEVGTSDSKSVINIDIDTLAMEQATLISKFLPVMLHGTISGTIDMNVDLIQGQNTTGKIALKIKNFKLPTQTIYGFNLPDVKVAEVNTDLAVGSGKMTINAFDIGKDIQKDDLVAKITGDGTLEKMIERSRMNLKAVFELSPRTKVSFPLLEQLLTAFRGSDGKYSVRLSGPLSALEPSPGG